MGSPCGGPNSCLADRGVPPPPGLVMEKLLGTGLASVGLLLAVNPSLKGMPKAVPEISICDKYNVACKAINTH